MRKTAVLTRLLRRLRSCTESEIRRLQTDTFYTNAYPKLSRRPTRGLARRDSVSRMVTLGDCVKFSPHFFPKGLNAYDPAVKFSASGIWISGVRLEAL